MKGYKLVPVALTDEMREAAAGADAWALSEGQDQWRGDAPIWEALMDAAPTPPQPIYDDSSIRGWEVGSRLFRIRLDAHKYITSGQSHVDGNGSKLEPLYRAKAVEVGHE